MYVQVITKTVFSIKIFRGDRQPAFDRILCRYATKAQPTQRKRSLSTPQWMKRGETTWEELLATPPFDGSQCTARLRVSSSLG